MNKTAIIIIAIIVITAVIAFVVYNEQKTKQKVVGDTPGKVTTSTTTQTQGAGGLVGAITSLFGKK